MDNENLEEIADTPDEVLTPADDALPPPPPPPAPPQGGAQGFPQLYRFMWGGVIVLLGSLLPFGSAVVTSMYGKDAKPPVAVTNEQNRKDQLKDLANSLEAELPAETDVKAEPEVLVRPAVNGYETFTGALFLLFGLMLIGQMRTAIAQRKVALGAVLLMFLPAGWAWFKLITITNGLEWFEWGSLYRVSAFEQLTLEVGSGFLLVLIGSTYVVLGFFRALAGAATGGKKTPPPTVRSRARRQPKV